MYLKKLEIQGFKSFANQTVLDFLPPKNGKFSITAIVGPNGSGKSNVTDAIRWVMGEQSMKTIRSKKSEDVIFNGSESKGAQSCAEVVMTLDNSEQVGELDAEEIVVIRRLYRSGESEYIINNNPARLLDIHLLMAKAQFAEHAYSIVSQGMIDRLLTVTPLERKEFFDEASGIKELQIKRHQAFLKLERSREHLNQAETIIQEIEPRLKLLARQVKKLEERAEVEKSLREMQEMYYFTIYSKNKHELDTLETTVKEIEERYRTSFNELETIQTELAEFAKVSSRQEIFEKLQHDHQEIIREKNKLERELAILDGQMHTEYVQAGKQNVSWLTQKIADGKETEQKITQELEELEKEVVRVKKTINDLQKKLEDNVVTKNQTALKISRLQNELIKNQSERAYRDFSGLTAVKAILDHKKLFGEVYGVVAELGEVKEEFRVALEVAAGMHLTSLVVSDEEVARRAIEYLRSERLGTATFLPLTKIQPRYLSREEELFKHERGVIGLALELIHFDEKFKTIFSFILGNTLILKDLEAAKEVGIGKVRMVTLQGDMAEKNGVMRGGFRRVRTQLGFSSELSLSHEDRLEEYHAEIEQEAQSINRLEEEQQQLKEHKLSLQVELETIQAKINLLQTQRDHTEKEYITQQQELTLIQSSPEEQGALLQSLKQKKEEFSNHIEKLTKTLDEAEKRIAEFNDEEEKKKQRVFALQEEMQKKQQTVNTILTQRNDCKVAVAKLETKEEDLSQEVYNELNTSLLSLVERLNTIVEIGELETMSAEIQKLKYKLSLIGGIDEEVTKEHAETRERFDFLSKQINDLTKAMTDLTSMIADLDELMKKKRSQAFKKIRKEFNRYFQILFEGGYADLEEVYGEEQTLEEQKEAELLQAESTTNQSETETEAEEKKDNSKKNKILTGIEVIANPPGKKIKYLNALSGGERTLTSIALICAILHNNPSPFVILDEVEAALDEANTQRFVRIMKELSERSQFILITHNRVTMHAADALYGVVMSRDGISKLLSVKLEEIGKYEEPVKVG